MVIGDDEGLFSLDHIIQLTEMHVQIYQLNSELPEPRAQDVQYTTRYMAWLG